MNASAIINSPEAAGSLPSGQAAARFNIVVAGEFNAGKSSVINLLLHQRLLPVSGSPSLLPPARIVPARNENYLIRTEGDGIHVRKEDFLSGRAENLEIAEVEIESPLPDFNGATITEVSVGQNGDLSKAGKAILEAADLLIWCTMGQRAWCLSEINIVEPLPAALHKNAILVVTRADYLRHAEDQNKVFDRLTREANGFFDEILMLDCSRKTINKAMLSPERDAGAAQLFEPVMKRFKQSGLYGTVDLNVANNSASRRLAQNWRQEVDEMVFWIKTSPNISGQELAQNVLGRIQRFLPQIRAETQSPDHPLIITFNQAAMLVNGARNIPESELATLAVDLALQLEADFTETLCFITKK